MRVLSISPMHAARTLRPFFRRQSTGPRPTKLITGRRIVAFGLAGAGIGLGLGLRGAPQAEPFVPIVPASPAEPVEAERPRWRRVLALFWRCIELTSIMTPLASLLMVHQLWIVGYVVSRQQLLDWLVDTLQRLGPVGIKWGQWASTR